MHGPDSLTIHATTVAINGRGLLIRGPSGSGKSALALDLISRGAVLVADDRTIVRRKGPQLIADVPEAIRGRIEARGVGILSVPVAAPVPIVLVADLEQHETHRLPEHHETEILGVRIALARKCEFPHFSAALSVYLMGNRAD